jgi:site-specific DNA-cytosine methylase
VNERTILDLCGGTGAWSQPYRDAGYSTVVVDPNAIELPNGQTYRGTVAEFNAEIDKDRVKPKFHGVLAAPPCTEFARCGARWWKTKPPELLENAVAVVMQCLWTADAVEPNFWVIENPVGRLTQWLGPPVFRFQPWEFGDPWTKQTWLWGHFYKPKKIEGAKKPEGLSVPGHRSQQGKRHLNTLDFEKALKLGLVRPDWVHKMGPSPDRARLRSITPPGFARAFFEANP